MNALGITVRNALAAMVVAALVGIGAIAGGSVVVADAGGTGQLPPPPPPPPPPSTDSHGWVG